MSLGHNAYPEHRINTILGLGEFGLDDHIRAVHFNLLNQVLRSLSRLGTFLLIEDPFAFEAFGLEAAEARNATRRSRAAERVFILIFTL